MVSRENRARSKGGRGQGEAVPLLHLDAS